MVHLLGSGVAQRVSAEKISASALVDRKLPLNPAGVTWILTKKRNKSL